MPCCLFLYTEEHAQCTYYRFLIYRVDKLCNNTITDKMCSMQWRLSIAVRPTLILIHYNISCSICRRFTAVNKNFFLDCT